MLKCRDVVKEGSCWSVGNGENINIRCDPWVPNLPSKAPQLKQMAAESTTAVQELIVKDQNIWDEVKLQQLSTPHEVSKFFEIHIPTAQDESLSD